MSQWVLTSTRWALYLRDGLACLYCRATLAELVEEQEELFCSACNAPKEKSGRGSNVLSFPQQDGADVSVRETNCGSGNSPF